MTHTYQVKGTNGTWSPPIDERMVWDYIRRGFIKPHTRVRDLEGREFSAGENPTFAAIFRQNGVNPDEKSSPGTTTEIPLPPIREAGRTIATGNEVAGTIMVSIGSMLTIAALLLSLIGVTNLLLVIALLFVSLMVGRWAATKGLSFMWALGLSLCFSPLIGGIWVAVQPANTDVVDRQAITTGKGKKCPYCAEVIKPEAIRCRYCGADLTK